MNHYLIVFDRSNSDVIRCEQYETRSEALQARFAAEREFGHSDDIEVVVLGARSQDAMRRTHSRYFKGLSQLLDAALPGLPA
jgi:hypothetical protein